MQTEQVAGNQTGKLPETSRSRVDWKAAHELYLKGKSFGEISRTYGISKTAVIKRAQAEKWVSPRLPVTKETGFAEELSKNTLRAAHLRSNGKRTPQRAARILDLIELGMTPVRAALASGLGESTFHQWQREDAEFQELVAVAQGEFESNCLLNIHSKAYKDWNADKWLLESNPATRELYRTDKAPGGNSVNIQVNVGRADIDVVGELLGAAMNRQLTDIIENAPPIDVTPDNVSNIPEPLLIDKSLDDPSA
jgi:hypothetical protein